MSIMGCDHCDAIVDTDYVEGVWIDGLTRHCTDEFYCDEDCHAEHLEQVEDYEDTHASLLAGRI